MADVTNGTVLGGRYRVIEKIGSGGMADVWSASDETLHRKVALKVLHPRFAQDHEFIERFRREAESAAGLQHPNVVGIFDRGSAEGTYYIAMELLEGRSLAALISDGLTPGQSVRIVRQILEAASFAHRNGIVHRDFKPSNVIVGADGNATVTDFGIARAGVSEITQTGSVMGTAHYLSPEQAQGLDVTPVSDLYSIGVLLYEALTGRVPFDGESAVAVALKQVSQTPQPPRELNDQVSPALDAVVMRALEKDPQRRYPDAATFIAALDEAGTDPSTVAVAPAALVAEEEEYEAYLAARRRRNRALLLAALAILAGVAAAFLLTRDTPTTVVPDVLGEDLEVATLQLREEGFEVGEITRSQRNVPQDRVLEQDPTAEEKTSLECSFLSFSCEKPPVNLTISAGPGSTEIPPVVGEDGDTAARRLETAGFLVDTETASSDSFADGLVISSDPAAGETAQRGSTVTLTVSSGPRMVSVPGVVGSQRSQAVGDVRDRGLEPSITTTEDDAPKGEVISQSPNPGRDVEAGSTVELVVSSGTPTVTVPGLVSQARPDAVATLRGLGLTPDVIEQDVALESKDQTVIRQSPSGGADAEAGDSVTLVIGVFTEPEPEPEPDPQPDPGPIDPAAPPRPGGRAAAL